MLSWARRNRDILRSDFGRDYGWFVERRGRRIAALTAPTWDVDSQFWHVYHAMRRRAAAVADPDAVIPWEEVKARLADRS